MMRKFLQYIYLILISSGLAFSQATTSATSGGTTVTGNLTVTGAITTGSCSGCGGAGSSTFDSTSIGAPAATASWSFSNPAWQFVLQGTAPASSATGTAGTTLTSFTAPAGGAATNANTTGGAGAVGTAVTGGAGGLSTGTAVNSASGSPISATMGLPGAGGSGTGTTLGPLTTQYPSSLSGTVNTQNASSGTCTANCVSWVSGPPLSLFGPGQTITINGSNFTVATSPSGAKSPTLLQLSTAPGTQTGVSFSGFCCSAASDVFNLHNATFFNPGLSVINPFAATGVVAGAATSAGEVDVLYAQYNQWQGSGPSSQPSFFDIRCFPGHYAGLAWSQDSTDANATPSCTFNQGSVGNVNTGANAFMWNFGNFQFFTNSAGAVSMQMPAGVSTFYASPQLEFMGNGSNSTDDIGWCLPGTFASGSGANLFCKQTIFVMSADGKTQQTLNSVVWTTWMLGSRQFINNSGGTIANSTLVKYDTTTGHAGDVVAATTADHGTTGVILGYMLTSGGGTCANAAACTVAQWGIEAGDLTSSNTCAMGNNVVVSSATNGDVMCEAVGTSTSDIIGKAISAETGGGLVSVNINCCIPGDVPVSGAVSGAVLGATAAGTPAWSAALGSNNMVLGGGAGAVPKTAAGLTTDGTSALTLGVAGTSVGSVAFNNATSGTLTLSPVTGALGTHTISVPAAGGTMAVSAVGPVALSAAGAVSLQNSTPANVTTALGTDTEYFTASGSAATTNDMIVGDSSGGIKDSGTLVPAGCTASECNMVVGAPGIVPGMSVLTGVALGNTALNTHWMKFHNDITRKLGTSCALGVQTLDATFHMHAGVYSLSGTTATLQWDCGQMSTAAIGQVSNTSVTAYTMVPGDYYISFCSDVNTTFVPYVLYDTTAATTGPSTFAGGTNSSRDVGVDTTDVCTAAAAALPATATTTNIAFTRNTTVVDVPYIVSVNP